MKRIIILLVLVSCNKKELETMVKGEDGYSIVARSAQVDSSICSNGGYITSLAQDQDRDNLFTDQDVPFIQSVVVVCNGINGVNGIDGQKGDKGDSGSQGLVGENGKDGLNGIDGQDGINGVDGKDGADGVNASNSPFNVVDIVYPCGYSTPYGEVILKLNNGLYLASLSDNVNGYNTRFSLLPKGSYQTTDGTGCRFTLN